MKPNLPRSKLPEIELPTLALITFCYLMWFCLITYGELLNTAIWICLFALNSTLFLSITHEVVHGHPTRNKTINRLLILLPLGWVFPYERFRDTHIEHHETDKLTDPFDDPESWYLAGHQYLRLSELIKLVLTFNNTLFGRMLIGPLIVVARFYSSEARQVLSKPPQRIYLLTVWIQHALLCIVMAVFIAQFSLVSIWAYFIASYLALSVLLVRTFLEHQAAEDHSERTVIIEKCCPIAFLFLYNNLHAVHHEKPGLAWYELPRFYRKNCEYFRNLNNHYVYNSYGEVFKSYFLKPKEEIAHPFVKDRH